MMLLHNQRGQSLIESCFALIVVLATLILAFQLLYFGWARAWIQRSTYQLLLCHVSTSQPATCNSQFSVLAKRSLPFGQVRQLRVRKHTHRIAVELQFRLNSLISIQHQDSLRLPLQDI